MTKIYCYSLDFQKKEKEYDSFENLLADLVGSKDLAEKSLNNPEMSYRGLRLISQEELPNILPMVMEKHTDKIKNDYIDTITELESNLKTLEKSERKASNKLDMLKDDYEEILKDTKRKHLDESKALENKHAQTVEKLYIDFDENINAVILNKNKEIEEVDAFYITSVESVKQMLAEYVRSIRKEMTDYNTNTAKLKDTHNKELEKVFSQIERNTLIAYENSKTLQKTISFYVQDLLKEVNIVKDVLNSVLYQESKALGKDVVTSLNVSLKDPMPIDVEKHELNNYKEISDVSKDVYLTLDPIMIKESFKYEFPTRDGKESITHEVPLTINQKTSVQETTPPKKLSLRESVSNIIDTVVLDGVTDKDYFDLLTNFEEHLLIPEILNQAVSRELLYKDISFVSEKKAKEYMQTIAPTRKLYNAFFEIKEVRKEFVRPEKEFEQDIKDNSKTSFDWEGFFIKYTQAEYLKLLFDKKSISLKEASTTLEIPLTQIKNMLAKMKELGYTMKHYNTNFLDSNELLFLVVVNGWYKSSKAIKTSTQTLPSILEELYPSWVQFVKRKGS